MLNPISASERQADFTSRQSQTQAISENVVESSEEKEDPLPVPSPSTGTSSRGFDHFQDFISGFTFKENMEKEILKKIMSNEEEHQRAMKKRGR